MIDYIELWHKRARPNPTDKNFNVQLGCHLEEFVEMLNETSFRFSGGYDVDCAVMMGALEALSTGLKNGTIEACVDDRKEFLDSLADQIVTATGVGYCARMDVPKACARVNESNWSKFDENGNPMFTGGKIAKGASYAPPDLTGLY